MQSRLVEPGASNAERLASVDSIKGYNVGICGRTLLWWGEYGRFPYGLRATGWELSDHFCQVFQKYGAVLLTITR